MRTLIAFIKLGRLHFLAGGVILHLLGVSMALLSGASFSLAALIWGQIAITSIQLMTHYANDYFDLAADRANTTPTNWSGGSRVLLSGAIPPRAALITALTLAAIALIANLVLSTTIRPGVATFALLLTAQALAWFYSAPPIRLHSRGVGETQHGDHGHAADAAGWLLSANGRDHSAAPAGCRAVMLFTVCHAAGD